MSHIAMVEIEVRDLDTLDDACRRIGVEFVRGQTTYRWYGESEEDYAGDYPEGFDAGDLGKCEHAIRVPGNDLAYEIGVARRRDGRPGYTLMYDFWQGGFGLEDLVGEECNTLKQSYALCAARKQAMQHGFRVEETAGQNGAVRLVLSK